jgi:3'-phosphoadenosine 5'-phosphosulfate sulfotransferase (PAPS reductase)/FAD synthetase
MPTIEDLRYFQAMPLEIKIRLTQNRLREWVREYGESGVYVSFSGGKDSTVLLHIVRELYPDIEAVFVNTGLEYPEIQKFVKTFDNVTILRPKMPFNEVIKKYGYPMISKEVGECVKQARLSLKRNDGKYTYRVLRLQGKLLDKKGNPSQFNIKKYEPLLYTDFVVSNECCNIMKKNPAKKYAKETGKVPITAQMAEESKLRTQQWVKNGCNGFNMKAPISNPMSFWTEQDVLQYIKKYNIPIASVYGDIVYANEPDQLRFDDCTKEKLTTTGCKRTGCIFCGFGCHLDKEPSRFQMLKETHPKQYDYCLNGGEYVDGVWQPNKQGLGMKHVFDELNKIYGEGFIKY